MTFFLVLVIRSDIVFFSLSLLECARLREKGRRVRYRENRKERTKHCCMGECKSPQVKSKIEGKLKERNSQKKQSFDQPDKETEQQLQHRQAQFETGGTYTSTSSPRTGGAGDEGGAGGGARMLS
jgi:hypothetical protein